MKATDEFGKEWWRWSCSDCGWTGWVRAPHGTQATHRCGQFCYQPRRLEDSKSSDGRA